MVSRGPTILDKGGGAHLCLIETDLVEGAFAELIALIRVGFGVAY